MKTLKELDGIVAFNVTKEILQKSAKEWLKEMDKGYCCAHEEYHLKEWQDYNECICGNNMVRWFIEKFFDLNE